jgi:uncharacterized protein
LLKIRNGKFLYEDLVKQADEKKQRIEELLDKWDLSEISYYKMINDLLIRWREACIKK